YTKDGGQIAGGLVKAGGSTLVMSGTVLRQWAGAGLASSNAYVPHFDLPGGTFVSSGASATDGSSITSGVTEIIYTGVIGLNNARLFALAATPANGAKFTVGAGSVITAADSSTQ